MMKPNTKQPSAALIDQQDTSDMNVKLMRNNEVHVQPPRLVVASCTSNKFVA